jgi:hypothetical protein
MKKTLNLLFFVLIVVFVFSCKKIEGEGGTSSISGKIYLIDLNSHGDTLAQYYVADEDVYIIYGQNSNTYNDDFATSFDGSYKFDYLQKGYYKIFAYSKCDTCAGEVEIVFKEIEITENYKDYIIEDIVIKK